MALTTVSTITDLPAAPQKGESEDTFTTKANAFVSALVTMENELNVSIGELNTLSGELDTLGDTVQTNKDATDTNVTSSAASAALAADWANEDVDVVVSGGEYSAKHYSIKSEEFKDSAETAAAAAQSAAGLPSLVGAADYALKVNDAEDGVQWEELPAPHPSNVKEHIKTDTASTTSTSWVSTGMEVTITVSNAASRVLLMADVMTSHDAAITLANFAFGIGGTPIELADAAGSRSLMHFAPWRMDENGVSIHPASGKLVYTPGAGEHTFQLLWRVQSGTGFLNRTGTDSDTSSYYRAISSLIAMEII